MENKNAVMLVDEEVFLEENIDFDELEWRLQEELDEEMRKVEFLEEEKRKISNPDELCKVISNEIWMQFGNQIGLDMTNETLIQKYEREHSDENYDEISKKVMQDKKYKDANKAMKEKQQQGELRDEYTGKKLGGNDKANLDHVVSRKELYENMRRKQAGLSTEELANKNENLKATNESLNKSKKEKSVDQYVAQREQRERDLRKQNENANRKIDKSNMSKAEKEAAKAKNNKRLQDKLDADDKRMKDADRAARSAINKEIYMGVAKETTKKAAGDALKTMAITALFSFLKKTMNGLVEFFKEKQKSFSVFIEKMKKSFKAFIEDLKNVFRTGASSFLGTVVTEIFGPIVSTFKKLASIIKQGVSSLVEAIRYLRDEKNREQPFSVKIAQVGKIVVAGIVAGGAILLGDIFEKSLLTLPIMGFKIPGLGTLANVVGMFLASLVSGLVGAIIINRIDKFIAQRQKRMITGQIIDQNNVILNKQVQLVNVIQINNERTKAKVEESISKRHDGARKVMEESLRTTLENCNRQHREFDSSVISLLDDIN